MNLNLMIIKCKFKFRVFSNPQKATLEELKSGMRLRIHRLPTPDVASIIEQYQQCYSFVIQLNYCSVISIAYPV